MRDIYLPDLIEMKIKNFTLYPQALDFSYDFVKGVNLVLAGNGMGKTTFVNLIKYAITGGYKREFDYLRTYKAQKIEKRLIYPSDYFKNRMISSVVASGEATVQLTFKVNDVEFIVERSLEDFYIKSLTVSGEKIDGEMTTLHKYEILSSSEKSRCLHYKYEKEFEKYSNLSFDDLIFFVHIILFFGEDHKTILWNDSTDDDVQENLFNKYFNSPELNNARNESIRQARYFDSLARHKSEDARAIKKVLTAAELNKSGEESILGDILDMKSKLEHIDSQLLGVEERRLSLEHSASTLQNRVNEISVEINDLEVEKNILDNKIRSMSWEKMHPMYDAFVENIIHNHICPMCNKQSETLHSKYINNQNSCFSCGTDFDGIEDNDLKSSYEKMSDSYKKLSLDLKNNQSELLNIDRKISLNDREFRELENKKRPLISKLRAVEFSNSKQNYPSNLQVFYDEIYELEKAKKALLKKSKTESDKAERLSKEIEDVIVLNTSKFSSLFSVYAESFLGVECSLTYDTLFGEKKSRFYPVINKRIIRSAEELSESQRFFVDHSFRMSILTFFYKAPTFYIVETPDSSLDLSYEKNAASVFIKFLSNPNSLIITSNLNNSKFIEYLLENESDVDVSIIGLLEMAKLSEIQAYNDTLFVLYDEIKSKIRK